MSWIKGISWTKGYTSEDGIKVASGPFFWLPIKLGEKKLEIYLGFRPTPTWPIGKGNEGIVPVLAQWFKKLGIGNFGMCFRIKKEEKDD